MRGWGGCRRWALALLWLMLLGLTLLGLAPRPTPAPASTLAPPPSSSQPKLATDGRVVNETAEREEVARRLPSLPLDYWHRHKDDKDKFYKKKDCAPLFSVFELDFHNTYWQTLRTANGTFHLYGAYLDVRNASRIGPAVRILAVHDRVRPAGATHCQLWFEGRAAPVLVRNLEYQYLWESAWGNHRDGVLQPYLLTCALPGDVRRLVPAAVSLVSAPCDRAANALRVHYDPPTPPDRMRQFAVCVKGLDFLHVDLSVRLVEWIELVRLLGADKIFFYSLQVHPNITKVLAHYEARGAVHTTPLTLPGGQPNLPGLQHMYLENMMTHKFQMEAIPYNDCLYRNLYRYRRLALLDVDEVIVPLRDGDWGSLLSRVAPLAASRPPRSSYHAANVYFLDGLRGSRWEGAAPRYLHMLQHVYRARNASQSGWFCKSFHETARVLALHNHFPLACVGGACSSYELPAETARLHHYRADCDVALKDTCVKLRAHPVRDAAVWRWRDPLVTRADATLRKLGFLPPHT